MGHAFGYSITIHKSQGVGVPRSRDPAGHPTLHAAATEPDLHIGITRGKRLLVLIGQKKALGIAVRNDRPQRRYSGLLASLRSDPRTSLESDAPEPKATSRSRVVS